MLLHIYHPDAILMRPSADIVAAAVLSGNRNFEGRVHPFTRANYLASPPLVVGYALAGTVCTSSRVVMAMCIIFSDYERSDLYLLLKSKNHFSHLNIRISSP